MINDVIEMTHLDAGNDLCSTISCVFREEKAEPRIVLIEKLYKDSRGEQVRASIFLVNLKG